MDSKVNKNILILIALILITIFISIGTTFAYLQTTTSNTMTISGKGACTTINYEGIKGNHIDETSILNTSYNYKEGSQSQVILSKDNNCNTYKDVGIYINIDEKTSKQLIEEQSLKYTITNKSRIIKEGTITDSPNFLLANVPLSEEEEIYNIYIWVDNNILKDSETYYQDLKFKGKIYTEAVQQKSFLN